MNPTRRTSALTSFVASLLLAAGSVAFAATPAAAEPTAGCRPVGGGAISTGGPHRATVVVDPGSGPVWSACVSFSGTISGLEALELAAATIPGLAPVYEPYAGQGRAVCRLLGVGNDPPNCLSKTVEYWAYFRNGTYARGGGSGAVVHDGDVDAWTFSRGTPPRAATRGTEAVGRSAVPTTTAPPPAPTNPSAPAPSVPSAPGRGEAPTPPSDPATPGGPADPEAPATTVPGGDPDGGTTAPGDGDAGTTTPPADDAAGSDRDDGDGTDDGSDEGDGTGDDEIATVRAPGSGGPSVGDTGGGSSSAGSILGFTAALVVAVAAGFAVRTRRRQATA